MNTPERALALRRSLANWSDVNQRVAVDLAENYRELLARRITNAQLTGLHNVVRAAPSFRKIKEFVDHQRDKAVRAGREEVADYWTAVGKALEGLRRDAEQTWAAVPGGPAPTTPAGKQALDEWHCRLVNEFVQHLVAHSQSSRQSMPR